jgi:arginine exporter protein ArgO
MIDDHLKSTQQRIIFLAQVVSVSLIWVFVIGIGIWITNLISLSLELHDVPGASVGISIVAIPVFFALASILTYVFIGLQKKPPSSHTTEEK